MKKSSESRNIDEMRLHIREHQRKILHVFSKPRGVVTVKTYIFYDDF